MSAVRELDLGDGRSELSIVKAVEANPILVLVDEKKFEDFYGEIEREVKAFVPDLSTASSRKEIASLAYKVARTKTAIDEAGKTLTEDKRKEIKVVDAARKTIRDRLDALRDEARRPLDDWEAAEKARVDNCKATIQHINDAGNGTIGGEPQPFGILLYELEEKVVIDGTFGEFRAEAEAARNAALSKLKAQMETQRQLEAERAELAKLRADAAERERVEQERIAAEDAKRQKAEAAKREAEREAAAAEAERQRIAAAAETARREAVAAADRQRREAEEAAARREREAAEAHAAEIARIRREQEDRQREADRIAAEQAAAARAQREEDERRAADREHRGNIMGEAKAAFIDFGISETKAKAIVLAIAAGSVPHVSIRF